MTAALLRSAARPGRSAGLRAVEPRRDMARLAELLETAFRGKLDRASLQMVRDMKRFGRAGWVGWLLGRFFLPAAAYPMGFVWEQDDRIVGNASLMPVAEEGGRWVLANVAVHPDFRRMRIATRLVQAGLELVEQRGGDEVFLQVDHDNQGAIALYERMGFQQLSTRTTWYRTRSAEALPQQEPVEVSRRLDDEWHAHYALAKRIHPEGVLWPYPLRAEWFRSSMLDSLRGAMRPQHWVYRGGTRALRGALSAVLNPANSIWHLVMVCDPEAAGSCEAALLRAGLRALGPPDLACSLDYPAGSAEPELRGAGFSPRRTMAWMGFSLHSRMDQSRAKGKQGE